MAEALLWLAQSSVPRGALVLLRPDSDLVRGWATGRTTAHANIELVVALRYIYKQVSDGWRLQWAHVKGHSGHVWNDEADALATRGCHGEVMGFVCGAPVQPEEPPPPLTTGTGRYVWHTTRSLTVSLTQAAEVYVCSSFLGRHEVGRCELRYVPPGEMLPLEQAPRADPGTALRRAVDRAVVGAEEAFHMRPQALVFDAEGRDWEEAREWVLGLVACGIGQPVEELRVARASGAWIMAAARCIRTIVAEDVVDATGWLPPWERGDEGDEEEVLSPAGDWGSGSLELEAQVSRGAGPAVAMVAACSSMPGSCSGTAGSCSGAPGGCSNTPGGCSNAPGGCPDAPGGCSGAPSGCFGTPGGSPGGAEEVETLADWGLVDVGAGVGVWPLSHGAGALVLRGDGGVVLAGGRALRPPSPPVGHGERVPGGPPVFWPRRLPVPPVATPAAPPEGVVGPPSGGVLGPSSGGAVPTVAPPRAFAGWAADGQELYRALLPARVRRPVPLRAVVSSPQGALQGVGTVRAFSLPPCVPCACDADELEDDDVRAVRAAARVDGQEDGGRGWAAVALGAWHRFRSAALRALELPSPLRRYITSCGVHEPPD